MTATAPLILTGDVTAALHALRREAAKRPVYVLQLMETIKTEPGKSLHREQMTQQSIVIPGPWPFLVTFSIETGHPAGTCRHMSMSLDRPERVPHPAAVWMVAQELGFSGSMESCRVWLETTSDGHTAVNVIQPLAVQDSNESDTPAVRN